jgi:hypothetical protein
VRNRFRRSRNARRTTLQILPFDAICPILKKQREGAPEDQMTDPVEQEKPDKLKKSSWWWPGVVASSLAGAALVAFRGCWHAKMSWPIGGQGYSYQVCLSCGAKRLFDEKSFTAYGPFRYDLNELTVWEGSAKPASHPMADVSPPPPS